MKIILPFKRGIHSKRVNTLDEIFSEAAQLQTALENGALSPQKASLAVHHSQVSSTPFNFFIIRRGLFPDVKENAICLIINPEILERDKNSRELVREGCMSHPFLTDLVLHRYTRVRVRYDVAKGNGDKAKLESVEEWVDGIKAQIFQHECGHAKGSTIYYDNATTPAKGLQQKIANRRLQKQNYIKTKI